MKTRAAVSAVAIGLAIALGVLWSLGARTSAAQATQFRQAGGEFITVTVQSGDSLARYARIYGVSGSAMLAVNQLADPQVILPGQVITIPVVKTFTPSRTTPFYYTAQTGDTLYSIANRFEVDSGAMAFANGIGGDTIIAGKTYLIPAGPHVHVVQRGEHLGTIASLYGVTIAFLQKANPSVTNPSQLFIGQRILIPIIFDAEPIPLAPATETPTLTASATPTETGTPTPTGAPPSPTPTPTSIALANNFITVTVQSGESLVAYVSRYGVSGMSIRAVNPQLTDINTIYPGDVITIPVVRSFTPSLSTPFYYVIGQNETVFLIAETFEVTSDTLKQANPGAAFVEGQTILIPPGPHVYTVRRGDDLFDVAARYGVTTSFLMKANPSITDPDVLFIGQKIYIPIRYNAAPVLFP